MELSDILSLVKAGYTREEINAMEQPQPTEPNPVPVVTPVATPAPVTEPIPAPVDVPVAPPVAVPEATPQPTQQQAQPTMAEVMQSIAKLTSAVQANAIAQSVIPQGLQNPPTAEDMLAEIIRPTYKAREGV